MAKNKKRSVKKRLISELHGEKKYLDQRNKFLIEKLKQAGVLYEEAGKRVMDFVNENIKPLKAKFADFDYRLSEIKEYDKSISSALERIEGFNEVINNFKDELLKTEEKEASLSANFKEMRKKISELSKRISTVQTFGSEELAEKVDEIKDRSVFRHIFITDVCEHELSDYDVIIFCHGPEHIEEDKVIPLLNKFKCHAKKVIVSAPFGTIEQPKTNIENIFCKHKTLVTPEMLETIGYKVKSYGAPKSSGANLYGWYEVKDAN